MESEYQEKSRQDRKFRSQRHDDSNKISIMQSSVSRDRAEKIENKLRADFKGPGYYNPKPMFVKKSGQSITIPQAERRLDPVTE